MKIKKSILLTLLFFVLIGLAGCSHEQDHDIYILYTNDVHGAIDGENIGYPGVRGLKNQYVNSHTYVSLVDCGDFAQGSIYAEYRQGYETVMLMNDCEYDVACLGNQDFVHGMDAVADMVKQANFNIVDCNIKYTGNSSNKLSDVKPYVIKKYGHTKVAFIGVMTPEIMDDSKTSYYSLLENDELAYSFYDGNDGQDLYDQVQKTVDKIRKKVDYVVILSHLGIESKCEPYTSFDLIANTEGIDVVIDGHSHTVNSGEIIVNKNGEGVVLTSTGEKLENIGVLVLHKDHTYTTTLYSNVEDKDAFVTAEVNDVKEELAKHGY